MKNFAAVLLTTLSAMGATYTSPTCSYADVTATIAFTHPGDTVMLPAGTASWTQTLSIGGISLIGTGTNSTVIVDETPQTQTPLIQFNTTTNLTRISGLQISVGQTNKYPYQNFLGEVVVYGTSYLWRVDNCMFAWNTGKPIHVNGSCYGVIDHCSFLMNNAAGSQSGNAIEVQDSGYGDASWAAPYTYGSSNAVYVENCYFYNFRHLDTSSAVAIDVYGGGRICVRYNQFVGVYFNTHGTETGQDYRSVRSFEVYSNYFEDSQASSQYNNYAFCMDIRGGTGIICSNYCQGYQWFAVGHNYRSTDNDPAFTPFWGATGVNPWDNNGALALSGTASATSNSLFVASASWTPGQWVGYTVFNPNPIGGYTNSGIVSGNDAKTMTFSTSRTSTYQVKFNSGDTFVVHLAYPQIDQVGRGQGTMLANHTSPVWPNEASQPAYCWQNNLVKFQGSPTVWNTNMVAGPSIVPGGGTEYPPGPYAIAIVEGRDFTNAPLAGFVPFTYPHPLAVPAAIPNSFTFGAFRL